MGERFTGPAGELIHAEIRQTWTHGWERAVSARAGMMYPLEDQFY